MGLKKAIRFFKAIGIFLICFAAGLRFFEPVNIRTAYEYAQKYFKREKEKHDT